MPLIKLLSPGYWYVRSKKDSRWNYSEYGNVGGCMMPIACERYLDNLKRELNEEPPDDLEWGYDKI